MGNFGLSPTATVATKKDYEVETNAGETMSEMLAKPNPLGLTITEMKAEPEVGKVGNPSML
jgi:hypothetical protein